MTSLEHVTIGNKLAYVAKSAFSWCNLTEIHGETELQKSETVRLLVTKTYDGFDS